MADEPKPHKHLLGAYAKHPHWQPVAFKLPDDPGIGVFVTNVSELDKASTMRAYYALHPEADFSIGPPKGVDKMDVDTLKKQNIVGIYANRKANG